MNRKTPPVPARPSMLIEALEPRIAPAGLLNEAKFTSVVVGGSITLDASGGAGDFQGLSTAFGSHAGSYLLYLTSGRAVVFTTDLNGNGRLDSNEITGISLGPDAQGHLPNLLLFTDVHGDIVTNLANTSGSGILTDSDSNPSNGRDGRVLLDNAIGGITLRTLTATDIDQTVPGNTVANRLALTHFSIYGDIISGGDFGGLTIDNSGSGALAAKFAVNLNTSVSTGAEITIGGILTGTAANNYDYHFTQNSPQILAGSTTGATELVSQNVAAGSLLPFHVPAGEHGGDISSVGAASQGTAFSIGVIATGDGGLGTATGARGGNISAVTMQGDAGSYAVIAGNGGTGANGGVGGSISDFNDLSSLTGQVLLHSGDGGRGVLGKGGVGGTVTLATANIAADLEIVLGNGGDGYNHGGNGASFPTATITAPDVTLPIGGKILGTWHDIGDVGNTHPITNGSATAIYSPEAIDFNGDGFGDAVYTSTNPSQVVVVFGDGNGGFSDGSDGLPSKTVILKVPGGGTPVVTVGDFNGDGKPDIAVASGDLNNAGGVEIFLNQIGNSTLNPLSGSIYTHNPVGNHPFSAAMQTAVPFLSGLEGTYDQAGAITGLAAGDFNGDGITDIAYSERVQLIVNNQVGQIVGVLFGEQATSLNTNAATAGAHVATTFFNGSLDNGLINNTTGRPEGTGFFYANPGPTGSSSLNQVSGFFGTVAPIVLHATSLTNGNVPTVATNGLPAGSEYVVVALQNDGDNSKAVSVFTASAPDPISHIPTQVGVDGALTFPLGQVDTNRNLDDANGQQRAYQDFILQDFTISDINQDGRADITSVALQPQSFLAVNFGDAATGSFVPATGSTGDDNAGIFLGVTHPPSIALTSSDPSGTGHFDGITLVNLLSPPATTIQEYRLAAGQVANSAATLTDANDTGVFGATGIATADAAVDTIDGFYVTVPEFNHLNNAIVANPFPLTGYALLAPDTSSVLYEGAYLVTQALLPGVGLSTGIKGLTQNGINIFSGNGGNSSNGIGGDAGAIGTGSLNIGTELTTTASVQLHYTRSDAYQGGSLLLGGQGGNGFAGGGVGGAIEGVSARYNGVGIGVSVTSFIAGNGGNGISGDGGAGGQLSSLSIENGPSFISGSGGSGLHGGKGGDILGNTLSYDTSNDAVTLLTGTGGPGSLGGGQGGTISKWDSLVSTAGGFIAYTAAPGGDSAGGTGGSGGSITSSSLDSGTDLLDGALQLFSGRGGNGLIGGSGGSITNFLNPSTDPNAIPSTLTVIAGNGGIGVSGNGGTGGSVNGLQSNTIGFSPLGPTTATGQFDGLARIIAGDGGTSFGARGGDGGSLIAITATATSTPLVAAGGAGGDGLTAGGQGGSVGSSSTTSFLNSAAQQVGKLLIVAGKGGDAFAAQRQDIFLPGDNDPSDLAHAVLAFGGASGIGGNGGSVINVLQPSSTQTSVDVIAGNGGSTPNAGSSTSTTTGVGHGGSISGVQVAGTIGTISRNTTLGVAANPSIKSYSATYNVTEDTTATSTTVTQFIDFLASSNSMGNAFNPLPFLLDDSVGNVGMVAGAAGTVRGGQAARDGVNGSVTTVSASSILSIIAGSVDRVAPVAQLTGVVITSPDGVLGADKSPNSPFGPNGVLDYYNAAGVDQPSLEAGDRLIDGAIFATIIVQNAGRPITGPRVF